MNEPAAGRQARKYDLDRTTTFSDGVFAIAITLLVLSIEVPALSGSTSQQFDQLFDNSDQFFAYFLSFAVIGKFWLAHHRMFGYLGSVDGRLIGLNLVYLSFIALTPFSTELLGNDSSESVAVVVYATNLALVGIASTLMWLHAYRSGLVAHERLPAGGSEGQLMMMLPPWMIFLASIPVALVAPGAATWMWILIFFAQPRFFTRSHRG